ncbi:hypothetical protein JJB67_15595 [Clostridium perfringens]|uniref:hypothetical protein n=1 Tax=Clostridium perfringens TaxID=1502 RepID=UPI001ABB047B|nr:hypothetical protein [Clostridium perfringens]MBO3323829.1 hypothetical protein [Clostridium perfringens]MBO3332858.1 hypothetical protein [Clostridium perfringens]MBO3399552.1 hypothetical protein [Clostridium perfringens]MBO3421193.1 hypothetical protein [Clostridium perfringens]
MESWEFVQKNKELIKRRLIKYNIELGEYEFSKKIILRSCFQPKKKKEKIYVDKKNPSTWKEEKDQGKSIDRKYAKTRERLKNPLTSKTSKNKKRQSNKNKSEIKIDVPNNVLDDLEVSLRVEKEIKEKIKRSYTRKNTY